MTTDDGLEADAPCPRFIEATVVGIEEVRPGSLSDFDAAGRLVANAVLDASALLADGADL